MKKNQFKKLVSTVTVASILGTSIATPFNVLTEQAQAAEGIQATAAPVYTLQNTNEFADYSASHSKENVYITWVTVSANTMWIDMTKFYKNYGIQITMPDGEIITKYKTINTGVSDSISVDLKGRRAGVVQIRTLTPSGGFERPGIAKVTLTAIDNSALLAYGQAVYGLFSDATFTKIGTGITQANIDAAKSKATSVPTSTEKTRLTNLITTAQTQLDTTTHTDAQNAVNALFTNDTPSSGSIKAATNQQAINNAQALINKVTDANKRAALQTNLNKAQELLNARLAAESAEAAATNAVNSLFTGGNPAASSILSTTNQTAINNAQNLINKVADPSKKAVLQTNLDKAQRLLNERTAAETEAAAEAARQTAATNAVNGLFTSNSPATNSILTATNQTAINNAQNLVNQVKNTTKKAELQGNLDKAQQLLNDRNAASEDLARQTAATNAVNGLFTSNSPATNSILAATNQTAINNAQNLVNQVKNTTKKAELQGNLDKAQQLLNDRNATSEDLARQEAARKAFNDLFVGNNHTSNVLKPSTDFMAIFNAYQLIKDVKDPAVVAELESIYGKAVNLLNARNEEEAEAARQANAEKAVNDLFTLSNPATNSILATTNQTSINAAQNLINQVKNATKKAALQLNLNKAQQLLNDRNTAAADLPNQEAARKALNELFLANNPATNMLKPAVTLADITIAGNLLDKVKDPTVKAELQGLYDKAANLYVARQEALAEQARQTAAEKAVNELFVGYNPATERYFRGDGSSSY
ncbi:hypothetical protein PWEIH_03391 [Listeria weihenstephanensis FSL R9-0317]|uniref:toxin Cry1Ac domain D-VI-related protein n=1 Tax=Listeria weihenstephanensis TaxID=1006155 RepID=UPI0003E87759|nr:toxin Cry1Ac domain D-VI-related protein [Listeria weihenstephanensis]EUJ40789.1 hypothetical protein PWEIH_03391 [Listeria weihenstephanensis FSL R9-0317]